MNSIVIFVAQYFLYLSILLVAGFWWRAPRDTKWELLLRLVVGGVLALGLSTIASHLYYDPRPFVTQHVAPLFPHARDNGFPSDHVLFTSLLGFTLASYSRRVGAILLAIALAVATARVAAYVHSPQDILGSFLLSGLAAVATRALVTTDRMKRARRSRS